MGEALLDTENIFIPFLRKHAGTRQVSEAHLHEVCVTLDRLARATGDARVSYGKDVDAAVSRTNRHLRSLGWWLVDVPLGPDKADLAIRGRLERADWAMHPYLLASGDRDNVVDPALARFADTSAAPVELTLVLPAGFGPQQAATIASTSGAGGPLGSDRVISIVRAHRERIAREPVRSVPCGCLDVAPHEAEPGRPDDRWFRAARAIPGLIEPPAVVDRLDSAWLDRARLSIDRATDDSLGRAAFRSTSAGPDVGTRVTRRIAEEWSTSITWWPGGDLGQPAFDLLCQVALLLPDARREASGPFSWTEADFARAGQGLEASWGMARALARGAR